MTNRIVSSLILLFVATSCFAYQPPIGVPDPGFGIDTQLPARPQTWNQEIAGYYFVDFQNGSDSNEFGYPGSPRATIPRPVTPGSYIEVTGTYNNVQGGVIWINGSGNGDAWQAGNTGPAWITSAPGQTANFTSGKLLVYGSYIYIDNVRVSSGSKVQIGSGSAGYSADHIVIRNSDIGGTGTSNDGTLVGLSGSSSAMATNILIYNNVIHDAGDIDSPNDEDRGCVITGGYVRNTWILENTMYNASGSGVQVSAGPPNDATQNVYVGKNEIYNVRQSGVWVKYATNVVFSQNEIHDIINTSWSPSKGAGGQYEPNGLWILYNHIYNMKYGVRLASTYSGTNWEIYIIGNVIHDINVGSSIGGNTSWDPAGIHLQGGGLRYVYNNVIYNAPNGINGSGGGNYNLYNNVISEISSDVGSHIWLEFGTDLADLRNNVLHDTSGGVRIKWGSNTVYSFSEFVNRGLCSDCLEMDPQFMSVASDNYQMLASGITDGGADISSVLNKFQSVFGFTAAKALSTGTDLTQVTSRLGGSSVDIGPFELTDGQSIVYPPSPPSLMAN